MEDTAGLGYRSQHPTSNGNQSSSSSSSSPFSSSLAVPFVQGQTQIANITTTTTTTTTKQSDDDNDDVTFIQRLYADECTNDATEQRQEIESDEIARRRIQERAEEGRLRAQAILRRFQDQEQILMQLPLPIMHGTNNCIDGQQQRSSSSSSPSSSSSVYVEQRRKAAIREKRRLQEAWSKNFAYVAARQDSETTQWERKMAAAQQREAEAQQRYQRILEERKQKHQQQKELQSQAGIGTNKRKRVEVTKTKLSQLPTVAVYISGIPRDGSIHANSLGDIFRAYGTVTKVHYYRDKTTGELKGDGLVVFEVQNVEEGGTLLQTVCAQVCVGQPDYE